VGNCDVNVTNPPKDFDGTVLAQKSTFWHCQDEREEGITCDNVFRLLIIGEVQLAASPKLKTYGGEKR